MTRRTYRKTIDFVGKRDITNRVIITLVGSLRSRLYEAVSNSFHVFRYMAGCRAQNEVLAYKTTTGARDRTTFRADEYGGDCPIREG